MVERRRREQKTALWFWIYDERKKTPNSNRLNWKLFCWIDTAYLFAPMLAVSFYQSVCLSVCMRALCESSLIHFFLLLLAFASHRVLFQLKKEPITTKNAQQQFINTRGRVLIVYIMNWHVMEFLGCYIYMFFKGIQLHWMQATFHLRWDRKPKWIKRRKRDFFQNGTAITMQKKYIEKNRLNVFVIHLEILR